MNSGKAAPAPGKEVRAARNTISRRSKTSTDGRLEQALEILSLGLRPLPVPPGAKYPRIKWKGFQSVAPTEAQITEWWTESPGAEIAIVTGHAGGLDCLDLDVDDAGALPRWPVGPVELPTGCVLRSPSGGLHYLFRHEDGLRNSAGQVAPKVDIRADGGLIVAVGDGREIVLGSLAEALQTDCPDWLRTVLLATTTQERAPAAPVGDVIPEGTRNATLTSLAGSMRRRGMSPDAIEAALRVENEARCRPQLDEDEVSQIARSVGSYAPAETPEAVEESAHEETPFLATEGSNVRRLARLAVGKLRHARGWGWIGWDGRRWARDDHLAWDLSRKLPAMIAEEALVDLDEGRRKTLYKWAGLSENQHTQANVLDLATHAPTIRCETSLFDRDSLALTCLSGTIDLATGTLRPHDPADLISRLAPVEYEPDARSPILDHYLETVGSGDPGFVDYLQRAIGYTLTGSTSEEVFFLLLGPTCTGKTTLVEALLHLLGDYGLKTATETFLVQPQVGLQARGDLAAMQGARLIAACEAPATKDLAAILVKELVGGDSITARHLYQREFTFKPCGKVWLAANDCPRISDRDGAVWRRLRRIPFENPIVAPDPNVKKALGDPSTEAARALFAWAVRGAVAWHRDGLGTCARVNDATNALRSDMDPLRQFYAECVEFSRDAMVPAKMLRAAYISWAEANGIRGRALIGNKEWGERLTAQGCERGRTTTQGTRMQVWYGVRLSSEGSDGVTS